MTNLETLLSCLWKTEAAVRNVSGYENNISKIVRIVCYKREMLITVCKDSTCPPSEHLYAKRGLGNAEAAAAAAAAVNAARDHLHIRVLPCARARARTLFTWMRSRRWTAALRLLALSPL